MTSINTNCRVNMQEEWINKTKFFFNEYHNVESFKTNSKKKKKIQAIPQLITGKCTTIPLLQLCPEEKCRDRIPRTVEISSLKRRHLQLTVKKHKKKTCTRAAI